MLSSHYLLFFGCLLFMLISFNNAIVLDIQCTNTTQCSGTGSICQGGTCRCDTPWYTPCLTTTCSVRQAFVYVEQECRVDANCLSNTVCTNQRCKCKPEFTALNGLCYKSLNVSCTSSSECWSNECRDSVCKCPLGSESRGDNIRCKKTFAKIYANWTYANTSGDFCYPIGSAAACRDIHAVCRAVPPNREGFCQCESPFVANYQTHECELKEYPGALSPSKVELPYEQCGKCKDSNALCVDVNQTTCWCRAGYSKIADNKCGEDKSRRNVYFPDSYDISTHGYTDSGCSIVGDNGTIVSYNGLCVCAPGYQYVDKDKPCQRIELKWDNDGFEYGVCTRIDSYGNFQRVGGLCPPLSEITCELRRDKHLCSCGLNKYYDEIQNKCFYFLERNLTDLVSSVNCPDNSNGNNSQCVCSSYNLYKTSDDKRRCELKLSSSESSTCLSGEADYNQTCIRTYGEYSRFCTRGECQCIPGKSFYMNINGTERCATLLYVNTGNSQYCPLNAESDGTCKCKTGYRAAGDNLNRTCERKYNQLHDSSNAPTQSNVGDVTKADCEVLYPNTPVDARNNACVCIDGTFYYNSTCVFYLGYTLPASGYLICPDKTKVPAPGGACTCDDGYKNDGTNRTCIPLTGTVHAHGAQGVQNFTGINDAGCRALFGNAAIASATDGHCECLGTNLAFWENNRCFFLVETTQTEITPASSCPPSSISGTNICNCPPGYNATADRHACNRKAISPQNLQTIDITVNRTLCDAPNTDSDCEGLHGVGAVCRNNLCYCDRHRSFVRGQECVLYSKYVFPGYHERSSVTCNSQVDCGSDADQKNIECDFINNQETGFRVCKCKSGYFLNPSELTCVNNRCPSQCQANAECQGYTCVCKAGYYSSSSGECLRKEPPLRLHETCNTTVWDSGSIDGDLYCLSTCRRAACINGYRDDSSRCVKNNFDDSCFHDNLRYCSQFSPLTDCIKDENRCACKPGYYRSDGNTICALAVNSRCDYHDECGDYGECLSNQCRCKAGRREQQVTDSVGRTITRCINGVGQIRFSSIFFLFVILVHVIFA